MDDHRLKRAHRNRKQHVRRRHQSKLASALQRAGLREAAEFAVKRKTEGLHGCAVLQHHPDDRPAQFMDHQAHGPMLLLPVCQDVIILDGDTIGIPLSALDAVLVELAAQVSAAMA